MKLAIGTITYGDSTAKYLPYFFDSLKNQTFNDFMLLVSDNSDNEDNANRDYLRNNYYPHNLVWNGENVGFARAYNKMMKKAADAGYEYFLVINPDVKLSNDALEKMMMAIDADQSIGAISPKILKWDFENKGGDEKIIDSCGIQLLPGLRFVDIGQAQEDKGQFDDVEILGPSGACALYRISTLQKVAEDGRYFDETMFMYKEDCDLAYRLHLAGFKSKCVSDAVVYHDRTVAGKGESFWQLVKARWTKNRREIKWSFMHQQIIYWKYWRVIGWREKFIVVGHQIRLLVYILLFEQYLLGSLIEMRMKCRLAKVYQ